MMYIDRRKQDAEFHKQEEQRDSERGRRDRLDECAFDAYLGWTGVIGEGKPPWPATQWKARSREPIEWTPERVDKVKREVEAIILAARTGGAGVSTIRIKGQNYEMGKG